MMKPDRSGTQKTERIFALCLFDGMGFEILLFFQIISQK